MPAEPQYVARDTDIAPVAALIADATRAAILTALQDGRPLAAGELAYLAGVSAATASSHLARLLDGGLVTVTKQGRHRYYSLAGPQVAAVIEAMAYISPRPAPRSLRQSRQAAALQVARSCYDHLAGRAGVELHAALLRKKIITPIVLNGSRVADQHLPCGDNEGGPGVTRGGPGDRGGVPRGFSSHEAALDGRGGATSLPEYEVTSNGSLTLAAFGINIEDLSRSRRRFAGACLDWTQRRPHLNGALGAAMLARLLELHWLERGRLPRALRLTDAGRHGLAETFGCVIAG